MRPLALILVAIALAGCGGNEAGSVLEPADLSKLGEVLREASGDCSGPTKLARIKQFERVQDGVLRLVYWASSDQSPCSVALYAVENAYATAVRVRNPALQTANLRRWCIDVKNPPPSLDETTSIHDALKGRTVKPQEIPIGEEKCERVPVADTFDPD
jgi:hypothetical protein